MRSFVFTLIIVFTLSIQSGIYGKEFSISNKFIKMKLNLDGKNISTVLSRTNGSDALTMRNDLFEIMLFNKNRFTATDYKLINSKYSAFQLTLIFEPLSEALNKPSQVILSYRVPENEPCIYKNILLKMKKGEKIDRLEVMRFSTSERASRGGDGQPIFIGKWFFGINYPFFCSDHSDNFKEPNFFYSWPYTIDYKDGKKKYSPRKGLVRFFHFPGYAKEENDDTYAIHSKEAVFGIALNPADSAELALWDYIDIHRFKPQSYTHLNNWYSPELKKITPEGFVKVAKDIKTHFEKYGAKFDAMVPDDGWQKKRGFKKIYEPASGMNNLIDLSGALRGIGVDLGLWIALDGTCSNIDSGEKIGYEPALRKDYKYPKGRWGGQKYFNVLVKKYQQDYKQEVGEIIKKTDLRYIKHDFNHCFTTEYITDRHSREACGDIFLDIIAFERKTAPTSLLINYTNGTFFTPFFLLYADYLWIMSGDCGNASGTPQICKLDIATSYRDAHLYKSYNRPSKCPRPLIHIADFMTHGILNSNHVSYFKPKKDSMSDWSNYLIMYYGRGTLLKELYISPELLSEKQWEILAKDTAWAQYYADRMKNTMFIGGNADQGDIYGYVSWVNGKGVLTVRNPNRFMQTLKVPFDRNILYRKELGKAYHLRSIFPFREELPYKLTSGKSFTLDVPGDYTAVYEILPGAPLTSTPPIKAAPLEKPEVKLSGKKLDISMNIPKDDFKTFNLIMETRNGTAPPAVTINSEKAAFKRVNHSDRWWIMELDLKKYIGSKVNISYDFSKIKTIKKSKLMLSLYLTADRKINMPEDKKTHFIGSEKLPYAHSEGYRRINMKCECPAHL